MGRPAIDALRASVEHPAAGRRARTRAGQILVADATIFTAWLQAHHTGDRSLEAELERRFSPEYASAFHDGSARIPSRTRTPRPDPPHAGVHDHRAHAGRADERPGGRAAHRGPDARDTANEYVRATVLFASVLLLVAIAQRFSVHGVRIAANVLALVLLSYAVWSIARLPRI